MNQFLKAENIVEISRLKNNCESTFHGRKSKFQDKKAILLKEGI